MRPGTILLLVCGCTALAFSQQPAEKPRFAGPTEQGFLLPNGWTISPVGDQVALADLPLNIHPLADGKRVLVTTNGYNKHSLSLVDLETKTVVESASVPESWFGLAVRESDGGADVWWSGGGGGAGLHRFILKDGRLKQLADASPNAEGGRKAKGKGKGKGKGKKGAAQDRHFQSGLLYAKDPSGAEVLYSLDIDAGILAVHPKGDPGSASVRNVDVGGRPYDVVATPNGESLYVSIWNKKSVVVVDAKTLAVRQTIAVGEHPNQMVVHPKDGRLFVACSNTNSVTVVDTAKNAVVETISTALFPKSPEGSTPDALALSPDGATLYVANADNNCIAVVDVANRNRSGVRGFIPTGWYPTAVSVSRDGKHLFVGVGKGNRTNANPIPKEQADAKAKRRPFPYIGTTLSGALSIVAVPDDRKLSEYTATVYRNCPYSDKLLTDAPHAEKTAVPTKVGDPSPIKYVIYIIKENRTYDQVFGDMAQSNADPSCLMFGRDVTPNHHKLAEEFVLLDNLYCNGQVSRDGHPWSTMAYNTDYIARDWMLTYSRRVGVDDDDDANLQKAPSGYIWDAAARAGKTYRSYGEYGRRVSEADGSVRMEGSAPGLVGHFCPNFKVDSKGRALRDPQNVDVFLAEFKKFEAEGTLPNLMILSLGEDHTQGTRPGGPTPQACVASNDLAIGKLVDAVSHSKSWAETAIFIIEDDAQNGPDHVDAHRTVGLVVSPYTKRKFLDSTQYTTVSMLRTIELILGLKPLSQYDAAARPMFNSFTDKADPTPYRHLPAVINLDAKNTQLAYGADRSAKMDFSEYDRVDDFELNEILWKAVKGADAPIPPPVRQAIAYRTGK